MGECDAARLHAAHREAGHGAMGLIGDGAEVCVHERNEVSEQGLLETAEVKGPSARTCDRAIRRARRDRGGVCWPRAAGKGIAAEFHGDDERLRFSLGDQVVQDQSGVPLTSPARFVLARTVLKVEDGIAFPGVPVVAGRGVDEGMPVRIARFREVVDFAELAMRHVLQGVKVRVLRGYLDAAAPTARPVEELTVGVRHLGAVDIDRVVMETLVERTGVTGPRAILALREGTAVAEAHTHSLGLGRHDAKPDPPLRIDLRILFTLLIGGCGPPVVDRLVCLRQAKTARQKRSERENRQFGFHGRVN